jgi:plasmid stability protein
VKNITVSVSDELYKRARVKAAENDTTVSAVVRESLEKYVGDDERTANLMRAIEDARQWQEDTGRYFDMRENLTRDELHDRDALRRHERNPVQRG